ncbi:MAG: 3-hydroxyacyl-CoA dehydrogenase, partial [Candidatus Zixiibacteriota bacterium]
MKIDFESNDFALGVVGAGAMGRGIAQVAAQAGIKVLLYDAQPNASDNAVEFIQKILQRQLEKGKINKKEAVSAIEQIHIINDLKELVPCQIVIEAIIEDLDIKTSLFQKIEMVVSDQCLLATNTSSLSVTSIAAKSQNPKRFGGFHFFNPVPLMKIVEVIDGLLTDGWVSETLVHLAIKMGHTPVCAKDTPGFIVNHAGRGYVTEAFRLLGENIAEFYEIDRVLRETAGFRMGPFELMDLTGLDVTHPVIESIYNQYYQEPRFRPSPLAQQRVTAGLLGRKTGRGFYSYQDTKPVNMPISPVPDTRPKCVWVSKANPEAYESIVQLIRQLGGILDREKRPGFASLCIVAPIGKDATTTAIEEGLDPSRTVAIDPLFSLNRHRTLMITPVTAPEYRDAAHGLFASDGVPISVISDSAGFIAQRVVATIVNIGCDIAQQGIATPEDIDRAVTLGL